MDRMVLHATRWCGGLSWLRFEYWYRRTRKVPSPRAFELGTMHSSKYSLWWRCFGLRLEKTLFPLSKFFVLFFLREDDESSPRDSWKNFNLPDKKVKIGQTRKKGGTKKYIYIHPPHDVFKRTVEIISTNLKSLAPEEALLGTTHSLVPQSYGYPSQE